MSRILIAEDEPGIARFVQKGLKAVGYGVTAVADGRLALEAIRAGDLDLVILDVGLPGIDGFEVLRSARAEGSSVPIIMLTARTSTADTVAGLDGGAELAEQTLGDELADQVGDRDAGQIGAARKVRAAGRAATEQLLQQQGAVVTPRVLLEQLAARTEGAAACCGDLGHIC